MPASAANVTPESCLFASFSEQRGSIPYCCPFYTCRSVTSLYIVFEKAFLLS